MIPYIIHMILHNSIIVFCSTFHFIIQFQEVGEFNDWPLPAATWWFNWIVLLILGATHPWCSIGLGQWDTINDPLGGFFLGFLHGNPEGTLLTTIQGKNGWMDWMDGNCDFHTISPKIKIWFMIIIQLMWPTIYKWLALGFPSMLTRNFLMINCCDAKLSVCKCHWISTFFVFLLKIRVQLVDSKNGKHDFPRHVPLYHLYHPSFLAKGRQIELFLSSAHLLIHIPSHIAIPQVACQTSQPVR